MGGTYEILRKMFAGFEAHTLVSDWNGVPCGRLLVNGAPVEYLEVDKLTPGDQILFISEPHTVRDTYVGHLRVAILDIQKYPEQIVLAAFVDTSEWHWVEDSANAVPTRVRIGGVKTIYAERRVVIEDPEDIVALK